MSHLGRIRTKDPSVSRNAVDRSSGIGLDVGSTIQGGFLYAIHQPQLMLLSDVIGPTVVGQRPNGAPSVSLPARARRLVGGRRKEEERCLQDDAGGLSLYFRVHGIRLSTGADLYYSEVSEEKINKIGLFSASLLSKMQIPGIE